MVGSVRVGRLAGHEVDEGLEGDDAHPVGIHYAHDARELVLTLVGGKQIGEAEGRDNNAASLSSNIQICLFVLLVKLVKGTHSFNLVIKTFQQY